MIVMINRIFVKPEFRKEFEDRFKNRSSKLENQPGFKGIQILRPLKGEDYLVITYWETKEAFERWVNSEDFREAHSRPIPREWFTKENEAAMYEVIE